MWVWVWVCGYGWGCGWGGGCEWGGGWVRGGVGGGHSWEVLVLPGAHPERCVWPEAGVGWRKGPRAAGGLGFCPEGCGAGSRRGCEPLCAVGTARCSLPQQVGGGRLGVGIRVEQWSLGPLGSPQSLEGRVTLVSQVGLRLTWRGPGWPRLRAGSLALGPPPSGMFLARGFWSAAMCTLPSPGPARTPGLTALEMPGSHAWGPVPPASSPSGFPDCPLRCLPS